MQQVIKKFWIDESGDLGFKFNKGSSKFFIIVLVYLIDESEDRVENTFRRLKTELELTEDYEFKFSRCKNEIKNDFFKIFKEFNFRYKAIFVNKRKIYKFSSHQLYCELVRRLLYDNNPLIESAILNIDEATAKIHHQEFNAVLKKYLSRTVVGKIRQKRSKNEIMIQIADMIAGSIFRKYEKKNEKYYEEVKSKEKILIEF